MQTGVADRPRHIVAVGVAEGGVAGAAIEIQVVASVATRAVGVGVANRTGGGAVGAGRVERISTQGTLGATVTDWVVVAHRTGEALILAEAGRAGKGAGLAGEGGHLRIVTVQRGDC